MTDLTKLTAAQAARRIAAGTLTATDLAAALLDRASLREPMIHAWAHLDPDLVLAQAQAIDRMGARGSLAGVPVGVKDIMDTHDQPSAYGSPIHAGNRPPTDAAAVALARASGAVIMGKTVTAELAFRHPGPTRNPHNTSHSPGGSSSGSAAAVADFQVPIATGTQTAGSVIRPAAFCGVVGFKPSYGEIPTVGVKACAWSLDTVGLFARSVEDVALGRAALLGISPARLDPAQAPLPRVGLCRTPHWHEAEPATRDLVEAVAGRLEDAGARVVDVDLPAPCRTLVESHHAVMAFEMARSWADEVQRNLDGLSAAIREGGLPDAAAVSFERYQAAQAHAEQCRGLMAGLFADFDLLLTPAAPGEAPHSLASTGRPLFNSLWTLLHLPCITLPAGQGPAGLPLGVQLVGARRADWALLTWAAWAQGNLDS